jgi:hypothetical protein
MKNRAFHKMRALALCAGLILVAVCVPAEGAELSLVYSPQDKAKDVKDKPTAKSDAELKSAQAVENAADAAAALTAAGEFVQKYPKSALRPQIAQLVADKIGNTQDPAQKIAQAQSYLKLFTEAGEADFVNVYLLQGYTSANQLDEAFALAPAVFEKNPNAVGEMINLSLFGTDAAKRQNPKYMAQSKQYALKVIELVEADKKPAQITDATWSDYKTKWLPQMYQSLAVLALVNKDNAEAQTRIAKAAALNSTDPFTYIIIGSMANDEYQRLVQEHKAATGASKDDLLKKAESKLDQIIEAYAHALALTEGDTQYDQLRSQLRPDLESYYKYRNNGSTEGLQALIDKYKKR